MRIFLLLFVLGLLAVPSFSQDKKKPAPKVEPRVMLCVPLGVPVGKTTKVVLRGKDLDNVKDVKLAAGNGSVKILNKGKAAVPDKNPEKVGDTQVEIELKLDAKQTGDVTVIVTTANGETKPHTILTSPAVPEIEPNNGFSTAQKLELPTTVEGKIDRNQDVDTIRFEGKKGQRIVAEVLASRLGSPLDAMLTLYDSAGNQVASNDDFTKDHHDAKIEVTLAADGVYFLTLIDAHDSGSNLHVYRLMVK